MSNIIIWLKELRKADKKKIFLSKLTSKFHSPTWSIQRSTAFSVPLLTAIIHTTNNILFNSKRSKNEACSKRTLHQEWLCNIQKGHRRFDLYIGNLILHYCFPKSFFFKIFSCEILHCLEIHKRIGTFGKTKVWQQLKFTLRINVCCNQEKR